MKTFETKSHTSQSNNTSPFFGGKDAQSENHFFSPATRIGSKNEGVIQRQTTEEETLSDLSGTINNDSAYSDIAVSSVEKTFPSGLTDRSRGYTNFEHGERLRRRLRHLDTIEEMRHIRDSFRQVTEGGGGLRYLDRNLTLAIAFRESGERVLSSRTRLVNSFRAGGLDRLHGERRRLIDRGFIPQRSWSLGESDETEGSTDTETRTSVPAMLPEHDLLIAYSGVVSERRERFERSASEHNLSVDGLTIRARRIWTALFFGGSGGLNYETYRRESRRHEGEEGWIGSHFGAQTIMTFLQQNGHSLNDILDLETLAPNLYQMTRTRSAFIVVAEAEILDRTLPQFANVEGSDDYRVSVGE